MRQQYLVRLAQAAPCGSASLLEPVSRSKPVMGIIQQCDGRFWFKIHQAADPCGGLVDDLCVPQLGAPLRR